MRPSQDRRKKRRRGRSQDLKKKGSSPSGTTARATAVLPLQHLPAQTEHGTTAPDPTSLDRAVLPLPIRSGTTIRAVLPPIRKRYYR